jgi:ribulose-5-phosphate 4-epimerase/fuculose-1-phosphate aldolase
MQDQFAHYAQKLLRDRIAEPDSIRFYRLDDRVIASRDDEWLPVFTEVFRGLNITALLLARPPLGFGDRLIAAAGPGTDRIIPQDSETKTFHHDFPFIRRDEWRGLQREELAARITAALRERKAVIVEDLGLIGSGGVTVEQAYIAYSTIFHATFLKFCLDVLNRGFRDQAERNAFRELQTAWALPVDASDLPLREGPLTDAKIIREEICRAGRATVEKGLVDSFFGNISYFDGSTIYISQTASSLDELEGHIDPVPLDGSSTAGLSASSELPAHRAIYRSSDVHAILHGHPKFSVILSMFCEVPDCGIRDCGRDCRRKRSVCGIPVVSGELGAGGLAMTVPPAIRETGVCIVYGHGVFAAGEQDFRDAFRKLVDAENRCREEYFSLIEQRHGRPRG